MANDFDTRQSKHRSTLPQLVGSADKSLKDILPAIDSEATPPFAIRPTSTPDLVVNIGTNTLTNPDTSKRTSMQPIQSLHFDFTSGTVTFPATSGTITVSPGDDVPITIGNNEFIKVLIQVDSEGQLSLQVGNAAASEALALLPSAPSSLFSLGYVVVKSDGAANIGTFSNTEIVQFSGGGGSGGGIGGLDTIFTENFEINKSNKLITGQSAIFGDSGTIGGTLSDEEVTPIQGKRSMKFTTSTVANDWMHVEEVTLGEKQQGRFISVQVEAKFDGATTDDMKFIAYDATNSAELDSVFINSDVLKRYVVTFFVPSNTTSIKIGFQHLGTTASEVLEYDDLQVSQDNFAIGAEQNITKWEDYIPVLQGYGVATINVARWRQVGSNIELIIKFTGGVHTAAEAQIGLPNGYAIDSTLESITLAGYVTGTASNTNNESILMTADDTFLNIGVKLAGFNPFVPQNANNIFLSGSTIALNVSIPIEGLSSTTSSQIISNASVQNSEITVNTGNGWGSTNTKIRRFTNLQVDLGVAVTYADSATLGATFTIQEDGLYQMDLTDSDSDTSYIGLSLNSTELTTNIQSITVEDRIGTENISGTSQTASVSKSRNLQKNDVVRVHGQNNGSSNNAVVNFSITKIGTTQLTGVPFPLTAYIKDEKATNTEGGTFTAGSWQTRDLNTLRGDTTFISILSNQFVLSPGKYEINWRAPANACLGHKSKLRNITDSTDSILASVGYTTTGSDNNNISFGEGQIIVDTSTTFEIQHNCESTRAGNGFGIRTGSVFDSELEIYTQVKITKIK